MTRPARAVVIARARPGTFCNIGGEPPLALPVARVNPLGVAVSVTAPGCSISGGFVELSLSSMYASDMVKFKHEMTGLIMNW